MAIRIAVLLSGSGRSLENLAERLPPEVGRIDLAISNRGDAFGVERARRRGIETQVMPRAKGQSRREYGEAVAAAMESRGIDLAVMAGFLLVWEIPERWLGRVMNIHPSLLPAFGGMGFYGERVHQAVLDFGAKVSGCTVHFASNEVDGGPIIVQRAVAVEEGDTAETLAARVFASECEAYPEALRLYAEGRLRVEGRRVLVSDRPPLPGGRGVASIKDLEALLDSKKQERATTSAGRAGA